MGIKTVAIYSSVDKNAPHVRYADEAYYIGPPDPKQSYLNIEKIIEVAKMCGADAIHPGYGFLSQNPEFAKRVMEEGIEFIGPPPEVHKLVGDKIAARKFVAEHGVPVLEGSFRELDEDSAVEFAEKIGYPVMVKPSSAGGGIGMFVAWNDKELREAVAKAKALGEKFFRCSRIYIERYVPKAKHIEVQILADKHGNVTHLFERECSIQRRFQKVIEEARSPSITEEERERLYRYALKVAEAVKYVNAGTVEFIFDVERREFYFLEVNSRIQVEHPVTEEITGVDIVKEQLYIAAGEKLRVKADEIEPKGHAIEARVYAEDPLNNFSPSTGTLTAFEVPGGFGVRVDEGVCEGYEVTHYYDPLLAKVIAWGRDREEARKRLVRALEDFVIEGVTTNIEFLIYVLNHPLFISAQYRTVSVYEDGLLEGYRNASVKRVKRRKKVQVERREKKVGESRVEAVDAWKLSSRLL